VLKILHIDTGGEMRGGQHQVLLLVEALRDRGHENIVLAREDGPLWKATSKAGIETWSAGLFQTRRTSKRVDLVHAHDARGHTLAAAASGCPFVVSRRVAFPIRQSLPSRWKYKRAARYLTVSRYVAEELARAGVAQDRIDVVYDAVPKLDGGQWDAGAAAVALASRDPQKGRDLVTAAAKLAGIEVVFSNDIPNDLRRASMFVYITRSEGFGSAALVAMAMGIPVIASRTGGLAEVFEHEVSGIYTENSVEQIAACMKNMVNRAIPAEVLIENAKRLVESKYSLNRLVDQTLASYGRALNV
jgi:adenine/guanine phosphoribosyltransferase-like PRPP-binding protein